MSLTKALETTVQQKDNESQMSQPNEMSHQQRQQLRHQLSPPVHQQENKLETERSLSSDDTVFLNLPNSIRQNNSNNTAIPKDAYMLSRMIDFVNATPSPTKNRSTSITPTPSSSRNTTPTNFIDDQSQWSSFDEDTSFYRDKTPMTCSEFQSPEYRCGDRHTHSNYCNSIWGAYQIHIQNNGIILIFILAFF